MSGEARESTMSGIVKRLLRAACWGGVLCATLVAALLAVVIALGWRVEALKFPPSLGNSDRNIATAVARAGEGDFVFYVMSDPQRGSGTFRDLLRIIGPDQPAFAVICGDLVADPDHTRHAFFSTQIAEADLGFPVFVVPGNHCTAWGDEGDFTSADYVRTYGPMQYHFVAGGRLFLFLNNAARPDETGRFVDYASRTLDRYAGKVTDVLIFMHTPPAGLTPIVVHKSDPSSKAFYALVEAHRVRYVFMGDHHAYWKGMRGDTTFIITGGAGGTLRGTSGRFHHAVRMAVEGGAFSQTVITTQVETGFWGRCERTIVLHIWPLIIGSPGGWAVTALIALAAIALVVVSIRHLRHRVPRASRP